MNTSLTSLEFLFCCCCCCFFLPILVLQNYREFINRHVLVFSHWWNHYATARYRHRYTYIFTKLGSSLKCHKTSFSNQMKLTCSCMSFDYVNIKFWSLEIVLAFEKYPLCNRLACRGAKEPCFCNESKLWFRIVLVKQARSFLKMHLTFLCG